MSEIPPFVPAPIPGAPIRLALGAAAVAGTAIATGRLAAVPQSDAAILVSAAVAAAAFIRGGTTGGLPRGALLLGWSAAVALAGVTVWVVSEPRPGPGLASLAGALMITGSALLLNDTLGHPVGDQLLIAVGGRLSRSVRGLPVARLGGDEFAVIDGRHDTAGLAERLLGAIGQPYSAAGRAIHLGASIGIAEWDAAAAADSPEQVAVELMRDADAAMYAAKAKGGGARLFEDDLRRAIVDRVALGRELRDALARDELTLAYQPVVDLRRGVVTHVEALARWNHPQRGSVPPGVFIPIAEASGLMPILGRWVLRTACAQAAAWNQPGFDIGVCVNVSPQQLDSAGIVKDVTETLRRTPVAPGKLILELTESLFVDDSDAVRAPLEALRAAGCRIAIDDFGTGYSALSYLRRLPIDTLKLDRRFLAELASADVAVLTAILDLARTLGLETIAEGVETVEQLDVLRRLGCDLAQGYYLARPMGAADVPGHLDGPLAHAASMVHR
jgi:diguanylate cyclase (GGDEF)-like protein